MKKSLRLFLVLLSTASLTTGCMRGHAGAFSEAPTSANQDLLTAHQSAESAFNECRDTYVEDQTPWQLPLAAGLAGFSVVTAGAMFVSPFATEAWIQQSNQASTQAFLTAGLGTVLLASTGAAVFIGAQLPGIYGSNDARRDTLDAAAAHGEALVANNNSDGLQRLTQEIYEDCRVVRATMDRDAARVVLRDINAYRAGLNKAKSEVDAERNSKSALLHKTEALSTNLEAREQDVAALSEKQRLQQEQVLEMRQRINDKAGESSELRLELDRLAEDKAQLEATKAQLLSEKERIEAEAKKYQSVADALQNEVKKGRLDVRRLKNGVVVELRNRVLFPSGSAELNPLGKETLEAVSVAIRDLEGQRIRVEGHTDNIPVSSNGDYPSNWDLSSARALAVTKFLQEGGVPPQRLSAEARGEFAPKVSNKSSKGRALNRRIEIFLVPEQDGKSAKWKK